MVNQVSAPDAPAAERSSKTSNYDTKTIAKNAVGNASTVLNSTSNVINTISGVGGVVNSVANTIQSGVDNISNLLSGGGFGSGSDYTSIYNASGATYSFGTSSRDQTSGQTGYFYGMVNIPLPTPSSESSGNNVASQDTASATDLNAITNGLNSAANVANIIKAGSSDASTAKRYRYRVVNTAKESQAKLNSLLKEKKEILKERQQDYEKIMDELNEKYSKYLIDKTEYDIARQDAENKTKVNNETKYWESSIAKDNAEETNGSSERKLDYYIDAYKKNFHPNDKDTDETEKSIAQVIQEQNSTRATAENIGDIIDVDKQLEYYRLKYQYEIAHRDGELSKEDFEDRLAELYDLYYGSGRLIYQKRSVCSSYIENMNKILDGSSELLPEEGSQSISIDNKSQDQTSKRLQDMYEEIEALRQLAADSKLSISEIQGQIDQIQSTINDTSVYVTKKEEIKGMTSVLRGLSKVNNVSNMISSITNASTLNNITGMISALSNVNSNTNLVDLTAAMASGIQGSVLDAKIKGVNLSTILYAPKVGSNIINTIGNTISSVTNSIASLGGILSGSGSSVAPAGQNVKEPPKEVKIAGGGGVATAGQKSYKSNIDDVASKMTAQYKTEIGLQLPLPKNLTDKIDAQWTVSKATTDEMKMAVLGAGGKNGMAGYRGGIGGVLANKATAYGAGKRVAEGVKNVADSVVSSRGGALSKTGYAAIKGAAEFGNSIANAGLIAGRQAEMPMIAAIFDHIKPREWTFDWDLYPRNAEEAKQMVNFVNDLKYHSLPKISNNRWGTDLQAQLKGYNDGLMEFPDFMEFNFKDVGGNVLKYYPQTKSAVISAVEVTYSRQIVDHEENYPLFISLKLSLIETMSLNQGTYQNSGAGWTPKNATAQEKSAQYGYLDGSTNPNGGFGVRASDDAIADAKNEANKEKK